jgi:hypothetical protein
MVMTSVAVWMSFDFNRKIVFASCFVPLQDLRVSSSACSFLVAGPDFLVTLRCLDPVLFLQFGSPSSPPATGLSLFSSAHDIHCDFSFAHQFCFFLALAIHSGCRPTRVFSRSSAGLCHFLLCHLHQEFQVPNPFATARFVFGFRSHLLVSILCGSRISRPGFCHQQKDSRADSILKPVFILWSTPWSFFPLSASGIHAPGLISVLLLAWVFPHHCFFAPRSGLVSISCPEDFLACLHFTTH